MSTQALNCPVILDGISTRKDGSLSLRLSTPELTPDEKLAFLQFQNLQCTMLLQKESDAPSLKDVKGEFDRKTPGQRLRACLFVAWNNNGRPGDFEDYYRSKMEFFINSVKDTLPEGQR